MLEVHAVLESMGVGKGVLEVVEGEIGRLEGGLVGHGWEIEEVDGWGTKYGFGGRREERVRGRERERWGSNNAVVDGGGLEEGRESRSRDKSVCKGQNGGAPIGVKASKQEVGVAEMRGGRAESPAATAMTAGRERMGFADDMVYDSAQKRGQDVGIPQGSKTGTREERDAPRFNLRTGWKAYTEELVEHRLQQRIAEGKGNVSNVQSEDCVGGPEYAEIAPAEQEQPRSQVTAETVGTRFGRRAKSINSKTGGFMRRLVKILQNERPRKPGLEGNGRDQSTAGTPDQIAISKGISSGEKNSFTNERQIAERGGHVHMDVDVDEGHRQPGPTKHRGEGNDNAEVTINSASHHRIHEDDQSDGDTSSASTSELIPGPNAAATGANHGSVYEDDESSEDSSSVSSMSADVSELDAAEEALGPGHAAPAAER
ncbi:MAG: hypothetical protein M1830_002328, partial [Pleopsidium flavum]